jgi:glycosyltransferase involved in cell wall biosynthesis
MGANASGFMLKRLARTDINVEDLREISLFVEKQLASVEADVIHLNSFVSALFVNESRPVIVTNHENPDEMAAYLGESFFQRMSALVRSGVTKLERSVLTAPSRYYSSMYSEAFGLNVEAFHLGVCLDNFPVPTDRRRAKNLGAADDHIRILLPSRLKIDQKGHDIALDACAELKKQSIPFTLMISGINENYRNDIATLFEMAEARGIREHINVRRYPSIQDAYESADVVVSPERYCSFGLSISEALATAIATVLSDIPTYREIAKDFQHALFVPPSRPLDLARQIRAARDLPARLLIDEAVRFREVFDLRHCARNFSQLYRKVATS